MKYEILPGEGLDTLRFGMEPEEIIRLIGQPDDKDMDDDEDFRSEMWMYEELQLTLFFQGDEFQQLICLECDHPETQLFGQRIFALSEKDITALMERNKGGLFESETEAWGEKRLSYDDWMMDFYFENGKLSTVNWSMVDEEED